MAKSAAAPSVEAFLHAIVHSRKPTILRLRDVILGAAPGLGEEIKWNAPSFVHSGEHRLTMRLAPKDVVQVVFHRGVKARPPTDLSSVDVTGRIKWAAPDRGILDLADDDPLLANAETLQTVIREWLSAAARADRTISETVGAA